MSIRLASSSACVGRWLRRSGLVCLLAMAGVAAEPDGSTTPPATNYFLVKGEIREVRPDYRRAVIKHEAIPGYMMAMTMPFEAKDTNELQGLTSGDIVSFRLIVTEDDGWIDMVHRIGRTNSPAATPPRDTLRRVRIVDPLEVGDALPDYPLTNQLGQAVRLSQFKGRALALTFIFTRCPYPNYCPRMSSNFAQAVQKLRERPSTPTNWHFLTLSFDPEFDTPGILLAYAKKLRYDPDHWSFLTGELIEIDALTEQLGLVFPREGLNFNHNFRTVVVGANGRIQRVFVGNEWKSEELVTEMLKALEAR